VPIAFTYGTAHNTLLPELFDFKVATTDLQNIFRAIMGLYIGMVVLWIIGILKPRYWEVATISNIVFMGGLAAGRLISIVIDGMPSATIIIGFFLEILITTLGYFNWKRYGVK
jgi:hypothetical protein